MHEQAKTYYLKTAERINKEHNLFPENRKRSLAYLQKWGFPHKKVEGWRKYSLKTLMDKQFQPAGDIGKHTPKSWWREAMADSVLIPFVNGNWNQRCSNLKELHDQVEVFRASHRPEEVKGFFGIGQGDDHNAFTALNTALFADVTVIRVAKNALVEKPIHLYHQTQGDGRDVHAHPRILVIVGNNAQVQFIESFSGTEDGVYFNNPLTEIAVGSNAQVRHVRFQDEQKGTFHIGATCVSVERDSRFVQHAINLGGELARHDILVHIRDEYSEVQLNGLYLGEGDQIHDTHSLVHHYKPNGVSIEKYRGVMDDQSHGMFSGRIHVHKYAQKTDAFQHNAALLLSNDAEVNSEPQLEIYADDVKCTHGAAIGKLDQDQLFYLQSRGLDEASAQSILTTAFAAEALENLTIDVLNTALDAKLIGRFTRKRREKKNDL